MATSGVAGPLSRRAPRTSSLVVAWEPAAVVETTGSVGPRATTPDADDLLRRVVGQFCAADPADVRVLRLCPRCGGSTHGRPRVTVTGTVAGTAAPHVSLSRAGGLVCVAVTDAGPVGVDCEPVAAAAFGDFAVVGLHPRERASGPEAQTRTWVRKESLVKATGDGLTVDLRQIRLTAPAASPRLLAWDAPRAPAGPVWMHDVVGPVGYVLAVTVLAPLNPQVSVLRGARGAMAAPGRPTTR